MLCLHPVERGRGDRDLDFGQFPLILPSIPSLGKGMKFCFISFARWVDFLTGWDPPSVHPLWINCQILSLNGKIGTQGLSPLFILAISRCFNSATLDGICSSPSYSKLTEGADEKAVGKGNDWRKPGLFLSQFSREVSGIQSGSTVNRLPFLHLCAVLFIDLSQVLDSEKEEWVIEAKTLELIHILSAR